MLWTHDPAAGQYVKIRIYKGDHHSGFLGGGGSNSGKFGFLMKYPTDTVTTEIRTVSNPNTFEYTGVVHGVSPDTFTVSEGLQMIGDYYWGFAYSMPYIADSQRFTISVSGLKPNTNHTFTFDGEDKTTSCSQVRTSTTNTTGLRSDANGVMTFDFYYDAGLDEAGTDVEARNRAIASIAGQKRFSVQNGDSTSKAAGVITMSYYTNMPTGYDYLNVSPSTTSTATSSTSTTTAPVSSSTTVPSAADTTSATGSYNVLTLDINNQLEIDIARAVSGIYF
jgi:hypothetical protein